MTSLNTVLQGHIRGVCHISDFSTHTKCCAELEAELNATREGMRAFSLNTAVSVFVARQEGNDVEMRRAES